MLASRDPEESEQGGPPVDRSFLERDLIDLGLCFCRILARLPVRVYIHNSPAHDASFHHIGWLKENLMEPGEMWVFFTALS